SAAKRARAERSLCYWAFKVAWQNSSINIFSIMDFKDLKRTTLPISVARNRRLSLSILKLHLLHPLVWLGLVIVGG
ncbi:hypothetical protein CYMTET_25544, partial [Cymbomonas tetramitiformis]